MRNAIIICALCAAAVFGIVWYEQQQEERENAAKVQSMKNQTEEFLRSRAHRYYARLRLECAKHRGGLPCEQQALLDCRALYGDRCEGN